MRHICGQNVYLRVLQQRAQKSKTPSCSGCDVSYSKQESLTWHHYDCGRTLKYDDCELELDANASTHGDGSKRRYSCRYCGKGFTQSGHLRSHQKSSCYWNPRSTCHQSQKIRPFSCTQCGACYSKQSHLIFHIGSITDRFLVDSRNETSNNSSGMLYIPEEFFIDFMSIA
ncbi:hypothetical protein HN011_011880 [Eciton burchellii]|nr:hypothetical protein HN011_011880 [Eciton burchellii]